MGERFIRNPDGILSLFGINIVYKKEKDGWQPYIQFGGFVVIIEKKKAKSIMRLWAQEGIQDSFWLGNDRVVLMGYDATSRQMDVDCPTVESCASPSVWIVNFKTGAIHQYRGGAIKREACDPIGYLELKFPKFFGK